MPESSATFANPFNPTISLHTYFNLPLMTFFRYHKAKKKYNKVTGTEEKRLPFWTVKLPITFFSFSVVFLLVSSNLCPLSSKYTQLKCRCFAWIRLHFPQIFHLFMLLFYFILLLYCLPQVFLALVAAMGVIVYRMAMITASAIYGVETLGKYSSHALVLINVTAGVINLVTLMMLTWVSPIIIIHLLHKSIKIHSILFLLKLKSHPKNPD